MYVIMVYDIGVERISKVLSAGRRYLTWIQNSVFEGEITEANFMLLKNKISKIIDKNNDSVIFYILRTTSYMKKEVLGIIKGEDSRIL